MAEIFRLILFFLIVIESIGFDLNCPKECKCYGLSVLCTRLGLNKIPILTGSLETL